MSEWDPSIAALIAKWKSRGDALSPQATAQRGRINECINELEALASAASALRPEPPDALIAFLERHAAKARNDQRIREHAAETWEGGTDETWRAASRIYPGTRRQPVPSAAERAESALLERRIAGHCAAEADQFEAAASALRGVRVTTLEDQDQAARGGTMEIRAGQELPQGKTGVLRATAPESPIAAILAEINAMCSLPCYGATNAMEEHQQRGRLEGLRWALSLLEAESHPYKQALQEIATAIGYPIEAADAPCNVLAHAVGSLVTANRSYMDQLVREAELIQGSMLTFAEVAGFINAWTIATPESYAQRTPRERELYELWVVLKRKIHQECAIAYEKDRR